MCEWFIGNRLLIYYGVDKPSPFYYLSETV